MFDRARSPLTRRDDRADTRRINRRARTSQPTRRWRRLALVLGVASVAAAATPGPALADDPQLDRQERWVLGAINEYRAQAGAPPVQSSSTLSQVASQYAQLIADMNVPIGHDLDGTSTTRAARADWVGPAAEIIADAPASRAARTWYLSDPHRAAMLGSWPTVVGLGSDRDHRYWVAMFSDCTRVSAEICAATGDIGDATGDILRWQAEEAMRDLPSGPPPDPAVKTPRMSMRARLHGRTITVSVTTPGAAQGTVRAGVTTATAKRPARRVKTSRRGGQVISTYRVRARLPGQYMVWASFTGRGGWGDRQLQRWYDIR